LADYTRQIESAKRLIAKYGQAVTFRKIANGTPENLEMPWKPGPAVQTDYSVSMAFFPVGRVKNEFEHYSKDMQTPEGSELGYMASQDFVPAIKDVVLRGGEVLTVRSIDRIAPDGTPILYIVHFES
jgi:hypothetical protein